jgi:hypothetical protein
MCVCFLTLLTLLLVQVPPDHQSPAGGPLIARAAVWIEQFGAL